MATPASASGLASLNACTIASRASCGIAAAIPLAASESSSPRRPATWTSSRPACSRAISIPSGTLRCEAARSQNPLRSSSPAGGSSEGMKVSQSAASVARCASSNSSLVASAAKVSPIIWVTCAL